MTNTSRDHLDTCVILNIKLLMDDVFAALAHPLRRALLDRLHAEDGQTLSELERSQPITRLG